MAEVITETGKALEKKSYAYPWYVVFICMVAYIFSYVDRQILSLLIEPIKADLKLSDTQFSLLHGLAFSLFYASMGIPMAYLADRFSRPKVIAIGVLVWSIATVACGITKNFIQMFLARMNVGIGEAALSPAAYSMIADYFPKEKLGRALAVYSIGSFIGGGLALIIGGAVIDMVSSADEISLWGIGIVRPWQVTFFIVGFPGILVALVIYLTVKNPPRRNLVAVKNNAEEDAVSFWRALHFMKQHSRTFVYMFSGFSFAAMGLFCVLSWSPAFYMRRFGMTAGEVGYVIGVIMLICNTLGVLGSGWLTDYFQKIGKSDASIRAGMCGGIGLLIPISLYPVADNMMVSFVLLAAALFFSSFPLATSAAAMQILVPNRMRAQVSALFLFFSNIFGLTIGSLLVATMTDRVFQDETAVGYSIMTVGGVATLAHIILLYKGLKYFRESLSRH
ncbi:spinster family MFS transporter [Luteithermobacter gelatinilyticus]|uniref:spinster family MFS transporter n=1 Tax=Luteithermobacter gelatinilyticus TaxID=2582913 RepID=UPI001106669F|nr:MFS transporter [Luteithermobacter gelatinilyticus]